MPAHANGRNGLPRRAATRLKQVVEYDEKRHLDAIKDDIQHGVVHPTDAPHLSPGKKELEERVNDLDDSWETDSIFADLIEELSEDKIFDDVEDACNHQEAVRYRQLLRSVGPEEFCTRTIEAGTVSARKLLTAFGIRPPPLLEGSPDSAYLAFLSLAISRELSKRAKLLMHNTVDDAVDLMKRAKNVIVLTGAGISTSLGIPDFRSKDIGLYTKLAHLGLSDPQQVFDIHEFREDPSIFYSVARDILHDDDRFSPTHAFIALLQEKGKLLTNYSQNIDNLEAKAGIDPDKLVQCHGSFATATCCKCGHRVPGETIFPDIRAGAIPHCRKCVRGKRTTNNSRKRKVSRDSSDTKARRRYGTYDSNSDSEFDLPTSGAGIMKPDITFFGEPLPDDFAVRLTEHDRDLVDLVIVIGTSLKVAPVSELVGYLPPNVPQIYISRTPVSHVNFDIDLLGDCDVVVSELCRRAGWDLKHDMIPEDQVVAAELENGYLSRHTFTQTRPTPKPSSSAASVKEE